jgi:hypothetical protein
MALQKQIENAAGQTADYWRVGLIIADHVNRTSRVEVSLYKDQDARLAGRAVVETRNFYWDGDDFPFDLDVLDIEGNNQVKLAYLKLKEPRPVENIVPVLDENGEQVYDELGEPVTTTEIVETNWFADALDV